METLIYSFKGHKQSALYIRVKPCTFSSQILCSNEASNEFYLRRALLLFFGLLVDFGVIRAPCLGTSPFASSFASASSPFSSSSVLFAEALLASLLATGIETSCNCDFLVPRALRNTFCPRVDAGDARGSTSSVIDWQRLFPKKLTHRPYRR